MFKIEISFIKDEIVKTKEWQKIRSVPDKFKTKNAYAPESDEEEIKEYGYVDCEKTVKSEKVIYSQQQENIDLVEIIKAVNFINKEIK